MLLLCFFYFLNKGSVLPFRLLFVVLKLDIMMFAFVSGLCYINEDETLLVLLYLSLVF